MTVKQKNLQSAYAFRSISTLCAVLCGSCIAAGATAAQTMPGAPGETTATMRLIAMPGLKAGGYEAGVEIAMSPGSHTYWKMPGEAGVPPVFAFNGSENIAAATVAFPVPDRITEEGLDAFGYTGTIVFPVRVTPKDPAKPAVLHADVTYAVCNKICLPAHGEATLKLEAGAGAEIKGTTRDLVAMSLARVPTPATSAEAAMLSVTRLTSGARGDGKSSVHQDAKPSWTLTWRGPKAVDDIFAEAPEGYFFTTKKTGGSSWTLVEDQGVGLASAKAVPVSLTLKGGSGGLVVFEKLDAAAPIQ